MRATKLSSWPLRTSPMYLTQRFCGHDDWIDRQVVVGLPDRKGREGILRIHTRDLRLSANVDLSILARSTTGFSGADLANLCNEAALLAARHNRGEVMMIDFEEAQDKVLLGERDRLWSTHTNAKS
jgi:cell division protease FtsH